MGKTSITLAAFKILKKKGVANRMLLVAPLRPCYLVWPKEIQKWTDFNGLTYKILHGPKKEPFLEEALDEDVDIFVINPEGLDWLLDVKKEKGLSGKVRVSVNIKRFKKFGFDTLCVDELSKFKHTQSQRFKIIKHVIPTFNRRWGLTGSPAANGLMGMFGQCYILDEGRTFGPYITKYRATYFDQSFDGFSYTLKDGADKKIYKRIKPLMLRLAGEDYLDLPAITPNDIMLDMPSSVREIYDQLESDLITRIEDRTVIASNAAVASMKCRQVASGGLYLDEEVKTLIKRSQRKADRKWADLHSVKTDALADLVDELQGAPLLLGHPQSIGHGLNLQDAGHHVCWYSLTWDYELYDQFIRRVARQGNKAKRVFVHRLLMKDTIDMVVKASLSSKSRGQNALFSALRTLRKRKSL